VKKIFYLSILFVFIFSFTALADDGSVVNENEIQSEETSVQPRYTYLRFVSVCLTIDKNGCAEYDCSAGAPDRNVRMKLYLQRSRNLFLWDDVIFTFKTVYDNGKISKTYDLTPNNYTYRAKVVVEVLDDDGNILETETAYSDTVRY
jgi:hypothetical protein